MKHRKIIVSKRRKREQKTNYKKRVKLLLSNRLRLVIRPTNKNILAQIVQYDAKGDITLVSAHSNELEKAGWKFANGNLPAAYLTGMLVAKKSLEKGLKEGILDMGMRNPTKGSRIFACLKGVVDNGFHIPHSKEMLPGDDRTQGKHIASHDSKKAEIIKSFEAVKSKLKVK